MSEHSEATDGPNFCDYPFCSRRGSGHPLACRCVSRSATRSTPTPAPDTAACAADYLRGLGWTVVEPSDAIPEPQVGQNWATPDCSDLDRRVVSLANGRVWFRRQFMSSTEGEPFHDWRAWVRRTNARPLPTPTDGATP